MKKVWFTVIVLLFVLLFLAGCYGRAKAESGPSFSACCNTMDNYTVGGVNHTYCKSMQIKSELSSSVKSQLQLSSDPSKNLCWYVENQQTQENYWLCNLTIVNKSSGKVYTNVNETYICSQGEPCKVCGEGCRVVACSSDLYKRLTNRKEVPVTAGDLGEAQIRNVSLAELKNVKLAPKISVSGVSAAYSLLGKACKLYEVSKENYAYITNPKVKILPFRIGVEVSNYAAFSQFSNYFPLSSTQCSINPAGYVDAFYLYNFKQPYVCRVVQWNVSSQTLVNLSSAKFSPTSVYLYNCTEGYNKGKLFSRYIDCELSCGDNNKIKKTTYVLPSEDVCTYARPKLSGAALSKIILDYPSGYIHMTEEIGNETTNKLLAHPDFNYTGSFDNGVFRFSMLPFECVANDQCLSGWCTTHFHARSTCVKASGLYSLMSIYHAGNVNLNKLATVSAGSLAGTVTLPKELLQDTIDCGCFYDDSGVHCPTNFKKESISSEIWTTKEGWESDARNSKYGCMKLKTRRFGSSARDLIYTPYFEVMNMRARAKNADAFTPVYTTYYERKNKKKIVDAWSVSTLDIVQESYSITFKVNATHTYNWPHVSGTCSSTFIFSIDDSGYPLTPSISSWTHSEKHSNIKETSPQHPLVLLGENKDKSGNSYVLSYLPLAPYSPCSYNRFSTDFKLALLPLPWEKSSGYIPTRYPGWGLDVGKYTNITAYTFDECNYDSSDKVKTKFLTAEVNGIKRGVVATVADAQLTDKNTFPKDESIVNLKGYAILGPPIDPDTLAVEGKLYGGSIDGISYSSLQDKPSTKGGLFVKPSKISQDYVFLFPLQDYDINGFIPAPYSLLNQRCEQERVEQYGSPELTFYGTYISFSGSDSYLTDNDRESLENKLANVGAKTTEYIGCYKGNNEKCDKCSASGCSKRYKVSYTITFFIGGRESGLSFHNGIRYKLDSPTTPSHFTLTAGGSSYTYYFLPYSGGKSCKDASYNCDLTYYNYKEGKWYDTSSTTSSTSSYLDSIEDATKDTTVGDITAKAYYVRGVITPPRGISYTGVAQPKFTIEYLSKDISKDEVPDFSDSSWQTLDSCYFGSLRPIFMDPDGFPVRADGGADTCALKLGDDADSAMQNEPVKVIAFDLYGSLLTSQSPISSNYALPTESLGCLCGGNLYNSGGPMYWKIYSKIKDNKVSWPMTQSLPIYVLDFTPLVPNTDLASRSIGGSNSLFLKDLIFPSMFDFNSSGWIDWSGSDGNKISVKRFVPVGISSKWVVTPLAFTGISSDGEEYGIYERAYIPDICGYVPCFHKRVKVCSVNSNTGSSCEGRCEANRDISGVQCSYKIDESPVARFMILYNDSLGYSSNNPNGPLHPIYPQFTYLPPSSLVSGVAFPLRPQGDPSGSLWAFAGSADSIEERLEGDTWSNNYKLFKACRLDKFPHEIYLPTINGWQGKYYSGSIPDWMKAAGVHDYTVNVYYCVNPYFLAMHRYIDIAKTLEEPGLNSELRDFLSSFLDTEWGSSTLWNDVVGNDAQLMVYKYPCTTLSLNDWCMKKSNDGTGTCEEFALAMLVIDYPYDEAKITVPGLGNYSALGDCLVDGDGNLVRVDVGACEGCSKLNTAHFTSSSYNSGTSYVIQHLLDQSVLPIVDESKVDSELKNTIHLRGGPTGIYVENGAQVKTAAQNCPECMLITSLTNLPKVVQSGEIPTLLYNSSNTLSLSSNFTDALTTLITTAEGGRSLGFPSLVDVDVNSPLFSNPFNATIFAREYRANLTNMGIAGLILKGDLTKMEDNFCGYGPMFDALSGRHITYALFKKSVVPKPYGTNETPINMFNKVQSTLMPSSLCTSPTWFNETNHSIICYSLDKKGHPVLTTMSPQSIAAKFSTTSVYDVFAPVVASVSKDSGMSICVAGNTTGFAICDPTPENETNDCGILTNPPLDLLQYIDRFYRAQLEQEYPGLQTSVGPDKALLQPFMNKYPEAINCSEKQIPINETTNVTKYVCTYPILDYVYTYDLMPQYEPLGEMPIAMQNKTKKQPCFKEPMTLQRIQEITGQSLENFRCYIVDKACEYTMNESYPAKKRCEDQGGWFNESSGLCYYKTIDASCDYSSNTSCFKNSVSTGTAQFCKGSDGEVPDYICGGNCYGQQSYLLNWEQLCRDENYSYGGILCEPHCHTGLLACAGTLQINDVSNYQLLCEHYNYDWNGSKSGDARCSSTEKDLSGSCFWDSNCDECVNHFHIALISYYTHDCTTYHSYDELLNRYITDLSNAASGCVNQEDDTYYLYTELSSNQTICQNDWKTPHVLTGNSDGSEDGTLDIPGLLDGGSCYYNAKNFTELCEERGGFVAPNGVCYDKHTTETQEDLLCTKGGYTEEKSKGGKPPVVVIETPSKNLVAGQPVDASCDYSSDTSCFNASIDVGTEQFCEGRDGNSGYVLCNGICFNASAVVEPAESKTIPNTYCQKNDTAYYTQSATNEEICANYWLTPNVLTGTASGDSDGTENIADLLSGNKCYYDAKAFATVCEERGGSVRDNKCVTTSSSQGQGSSGGGGG